MDAAQEMVDEAAKAAGYTVAVYHGTNAEFTVFDRKKIGTNTHNNGIFGEGFYFSNDKKYAGYYNRKNGNIAKDGTGRTLSVYLSLRNPFYWQSVRTADAFQRFLAENRLGNKGISWNRTEKEIHALTSEKASKAFAKAMQEAGYDGVIYEYKNGVREEVVFSPEQIKSADPVTYDDGNVIPLSERFNPENEDIRYSSKLQTVEELEKLNGDLQRQLADVTKKLAAKTEQAAYWKGQTKQTTRETATLRKGDVRALAWSLTQKAARELHFF